MQEEHTNIILTTLKNEEIFHYFASVMKLSSDVLSMLKYNGIFNE